jgi:acetylornithine deacetylase/succinyl-diaminopimelate desuccinylase-like protein
LDRLIDGREAYYLEELFTLLRQQSISGQNIGMRECADLLMAKMERIGIATRLIETARHPVVYGEIGHESNTFTLLIYGHYDVQPPDPLDEWLSPPFEPTIRDGNIYCRGAGDNKGQLMAHLLAVETYLQTSDRLPINLKFVFEGEEEIGSPNLSEFVRSHRELLQCDLAYTSDGPMHLSGAPVVLLGVRGNLYLELTAREARWDNHSGNKGNIVPNPIWRLMEMYKTMRASDGTVLIEGFYDDVREITEAELALIRKLPFNREEVAAQIGYDKLSMDGETYYRKLTLEPTFNISGFHSGCDGTALVSVIPAAAKVKMDIRLVLDQDPYDIYLKFCNHMKKFGFDDIEVELKAATPPSRTSPELDVVKTVSRTVEEAYGCEPVMQPSLGGTLPDYVWTQTLGVPSIVVPYANADEANHSPNENIGVANFISGIRCTSYLIQRLSEMIPIPRK